MANSASNPAVAYREYLESELASENERSLHGIFSQVTRYGVLKFGAVVFSCPFETTKILRQVQCGSCVEEQDTGEGKGEGGETRGGDSDLQKVADESQESVLLPSRASFVAESEARSRAIGMLYAHEGHFSHQALPADVSRDPSGYLIPSGVSCGYVSKWPLMLNKRRSVWHSMGEISRHQGLLSLWRGSSAAWCQNVAMDLGRASIEEALESSEFIQRLSLPSFGIEELLMDEEIVKPTLIAGLAQGIVATLLSPLELIRLRLAVQSIWREEQKYNGLFHTMATIVREEGGVAALFRHPILTFTCSFLTPVMRILPVSLIHAYWAPREDSSITTTLLWLALQNVAMCLPHLVTLPLETIRRRLLVQPDPRGHHSAFISRVKLGCYTGVLNCAWRVVREEGVGALYQGWAMQVAATTASLAMTLLAELGEDDLGADEDLEL